MTGVSEFDSGVLLGLTVAVVILIIFIAGYAWRDMR